MRPGSVQKNTVWGIIFVLVVSISLTGCEPLRKKFVREKKKSKTVSTEFDPVLEPVDYPSTLQSFERRYKHHYQLYMVWQKDFLGLIRDTEFKNDKRMIYLLTQMQANLTEMRKFVTEAKQPIVTKHLQSLKKVLAEYDKPLPLRNRQSIESKVKKLTKTIKKDLTFEMVKNDIRK